MVPVEVEVMTRLTAFTRESSIGFKVRRLRISQLLTKRELADMAGVSLEEVDLFERSLPLTLDAKRRILRELWAKKAGK